MRVISAVGRRCGAVGLAIALIGTVWLDHVAGQDTMTWPEAIAEAQHLRDRLRARVDELGQLPFAGNFFNEYDIDEHRCSILGRMLGHADHISHLEREYPDPDTATTILAYSIRSLDNWIYTANQLYRISSDERATLWNLDCVGHMGIPADLYEQAGRGQTFYTVTQEGRALIVLGDVVAGFAQRLASALDANPDVEIVYLGSRGGEIYEALDAAAEIRRRRLSTALDGNCYSACPLVLLGGIERTLWSPYPELGFHQITTQHGEVLSDPEIYSLIRSVAYAYGVDGSAVVAFMLAAGPNEVYVPTAEQLCRANIFTWIQRRPC